MEDFEDRICNFIIRKPGDEQKKYPDARKECRNGLTIYNHIPLLVGDILQSIKNPDDETVFTISNLSTLNYRTCLVYGYVAGRVIQNASLHKYIIDDGTGAIEFTIFNRPKESKTINSLLSETMVLANTPDSTYQRVSLSMVRLLVKAREYVDGSSIKPGSNILLFGSPNVYRNQISLNVISFLVDNDRCRNLEIAFADCLIDYNKNIRSTS